MVNLVKAEISEKGYFFACLFVWFVCMFFVCLFVFNPHILQTLEFNINRENDQKKKNLKMKTD